MIDYVFFGILSPTIDALVSNMVPPKQRRTFTQRIVLFSIAVR